MARSRFEPQGPFGNAGDVVRILTAAPTGGPESPSRVVPVADVLDNDYQPVAGGQVHLDRNGMTPPLYGPDGVTSLTVLQADSVTTGTITGASQNAASVPVPMTGDAGKFAAVNEAETGYDLVPAPSTPTLLSTTPLALAQAVGGDECDPDIGNTVNFTGCTLTVGEDYWGDPGSAQPLTVTGGSTGVSVPDDHIYDIHATVNMTADPADNGKLVQIRLTGPTGAVTALALVVDGTVDFDGQLNCSVFVGGADTVGIVVRPLGLSQPVTVGSAQLLIFQRV